MGSRKTGLSPPPSILILTVPRRYFCCGSLLLLFFLSRKELFVWLSARAFRKLLSIYVFSYFPFGFEGRIWDLIVSVPDHCLSFYFAMMYKIVRDLVLALKADEVFIQIIRNKSKITKKSFANFIVTYFVDKYTTSNSEFYTVKYHRLKRILKKYKQTFHFINVFFFFYLFLSFFLHFYKYMSK